MSGRVVGEVNICNNYIWWRVDSFNILPQKKGTRIWSPVCNTSEPKIFLNSINNKVPEGSIGLILSTIKPVSFMDKSFRLGLVDEYKTVINYSKVEWIPMLHFLMKGYFRVLNLCKEKNLSECDNVQLFCELINNENDLIENISAVKENARVGNEEKRIIVSNNSSTSKDVGNQYVKNLEKLSENLKELYITGQDSDLTIKVQDKEFKAHKGILRARSSVFNAMFSHELYERNNSVIPIEDCEPDVFEEFLYFIYSGKIQLSSENACDLYYIAEKYLIQELKEECIYFLKKSLSIETICDVICLSTKCNEPELLDLAITYFAKYMEEILLTVKWQLFLKENPTEASELTIKALRLGFTKKRKFKLIELDDNLT